jgi:hypothetical protein
VNSDPKQRLKMLASRVSETSGVAELVAMNDLIEFVVSMAFTPESLLELAQVRAKAADDLVSSGAQA